jgi:thiamine biosynthesis lipoprotein
MRYRLILRRFWLLLGLLPILLLIACQPTPLQEQQAYVFGTRVEVIVVSPQVEVGRQAIAEVLREFDRLHRTYHAWQSSELTELNSAIAAGRPQQITSEMADLIRESMEFSQRGDYLFDPAIGQLVKLWGFHADEFKAEIPSAAALANWRNSQPSIADLRIEGTTLRSKNRAVALDFGGYLKGVALDRAAAILRRQGINNALINIGGNVMALGTKSGKKWRVGIQHPRQSGAMASIELEDGEAIGTSGDYQRYFEVDGKRFCHLLDPRTAEPVQHTQAVTIVIPAGNKAGTLSDAMSKPIFIAGPEHWPEIAQKMGIKLVFRVDRNNHIQISKALHDRLTIMNKPDDLEIVSLD